MTFPRVALEGQALGRESFTLHPEQCLSQLLEVLLMEGQIVSSGPSAAATSGMCSPCAGMLSGLTGPCWLGGCCPPLLQHEGQDRPPCRAPCFACMSHWDLESCPLSGTSALGLSQGTPSQARDQRELQACRTPGSGCVSSERWRGGSCWSPGVDLQALWSCEATVPMDPWPRSRPPTGSVLPGGQAAAASRSCVLLDVWSSMHG